MKGHKNKNVSIENHVSMLYFGDPIQHVHELFPQLADKIGFRRDRSLSSMRDYQ